MTSIWADNLSSVYASPIAVDATLEAGSGGDAFAIRAMDKTSGMILDVGDAEVQSILPVAVILVQALTAEGLTADADLDGGTITLDGKRWTIKSHSLKPSPEGELRGEVVLILSDEAV